jgi:hypothetical protein
VKTVTRTDVGLFSFLKKKNDAPEARAGARPRGMDLRADDLPGPASAFAPTTRMPLDTEAERERQREIARATAAKIDEIELEMTSDIFDDHAWAGNRRAPAVAAGASSAPLLDLNTADLLVQEGSPDTAVECPGRRGSGNPVRQRPVRSRRSDPARLPGRCLPQRAPAVVDAVRPLPG